MYRLRVLLALLSLAVVLPASAQLAVRAPGGTLTGVVRDSVTGRPIGFALVILVERDHRAFANESGRFSLSGLASGMATLRVQQIGYAAVTLPLRVDATPAFPGLSGTELLVELNRKALVLPEIVVEGDVCSGVAELASQGAPALLEEVFKNAERLLTLQRDYPFRETYQETTALLDTTNEIVGGKVDTNDYESKTIRRYRQGRVITRERQGRESAYYFQPSDLAEPAFQRAHCFWYSGVDSLDTLKTFRIEFAPLKRVRSIDWAGSLLIDTVSMVLVRSEAHLVNLSQRGTSFQSASCILSYRQIYPTLVTPHQARCVSRHSGKPPFTLMARWELIDFKFLGRTPAKSGGGALPAQPPPGTPFSPGTPSSVMARRSSTSSSSLP
jgi:Carboxypeptidase regulatory-like domain